MRKKISVVIATLVITFTGCLSEPSMAEKAPTQVEVQQPTQEVETPQNGEVELVSLKNVSVETGTKKSTKVKKKRVTKGKKKKKSTYSRTEYLLARIAVAEAEDQDRIGKLLVMQVVMNRVKSKEFPNTVEGVIFQKKQFSPISDGRWDRVKPDKGTLKLATELSRTKDYSNGALYFCEPQANKWHRRDLTYLFKHGCHEFYK